MKKFVYYTSLVVIFVALWLLVTLAMTLAEQYYHIKIGGILMNFIVIVTFSLFFALRPFVKLIVNKIFKDEPKQEEIESEENPEEQENNQK